MNTVDALLELAVMIAALFYVIGLVVPGLREDLRRWAFVLVGFVFGAAILVAGMRAYPMAFVVALAGMSVMAFVALEFRRGVHHEGGHGRPASTPFLNLRVTGKTAVERDAVEHDDAEDDEAHE